MPEEQKDKKLQYLKREEVKTMQKDVSRLQESGAEQERKRISEIKTAEETQKEAERTKIAEIASAEREEAEKEAQRKQEEVKTLRQEREKRVDSIEREKTGEQAIKTEKLQEQLKSTQETEEEQRRKFLQRVEAKAGSKEELLPPLKPTPLPSRPQEAPEKELAKKPSPLQKLKEIPKPSLLKEIPKPSFKKPAFRKPSLTQKLWIRIVLSLLVIAILAAIGTFLYWYVNVREAPVPEEAEEVIVEEPVLPPTALISTDQTQILEPVLLEQIMGQELEEDEFIRLLLKEENEFLGIKEFFEELGVTVPEAFYNKIDNDFTLFVYDQEDGNRLGFVTRVKESQNLAQILTSWESTMEDDFENFFKLMGKTEPGLVSYFKDGVYQETPFRFQTFSRQDLGIVYSIFNDYFILTSSWKGIEKTLDKLKEEPLSLLPFSPNDRAEFILQNLTLEQKIGQMFLVGIEGKFLTNETKELINYVQPGGILLLKHNIESESQVKELIQSLQNISLSNNGIPLLIATDQEGGTVSSIGFGQEKTPQSEINNTNQAYNVGFNRGEELRKLGINLNLAPVLDTTNPADFLFNRSFQKDTEETSSLAKALISGQKEASILTAIKHFPGYSNISFDPEKEMAVLTELPEILQFQKAVEAHPEFIMTSNAIYSEIDPDLPFSFSPKGISFLKETLGNDYLIITDDLFQDSLFNKFSLKGIVTWPVQAGVDILIFSNWKTGPSWEATVKEAARLLSEAVQNGEISEERINQSVLKIIKLKQGLL